MEYLEKQGILRGTRHREPESGPFRTARKGEWGEATNFRIGGTCFQTL